MKLVQRLSIFSLLFAQTACSLFALPKVDNEEFKAVKVGETRSVVIYKIGIPNAKKQVGHGEIWDYNIQNKATKEIVNYKLIFDNGHLRQIKMGKKLATAK